MTIFSKSTILHLLFPHECAVCNIPLNTAEKHLCHACYYELPFTSIHAGTHLIADKFIGRIPVQNAHALLQYEAKNKVQQILFLIKYKDQKALAKYLGKVWAEKIQALNWPIDAILPIPLSAKKQYIRGYNQSQLIAEGMHEVLQLPILHPIKRVKFTESQTKKTRIQRLENIENAFEWQVNPQKIHSENPMIIDDVITTGATMEAYVQTLHENLPNANIYLGGLAARL